MSISLMKDIWVNIIVLADVFKLKKF